MKLEIRTISVVDVLGSSRITPAGLRCSDNREDYIDGQHCPKALETIILAGLDAMKVKYQAEKLADLERDMFGWRI